VASHEAFVDLFVTVTQLLGANSSTAATYAEDVWQLEKAIARVIFFSVFSHMMLLAC